MGLLRAFVSWSATSDAHAVALSMRTCSLPGGEVHICYKCHAHTHISSDLNAQGLFPPPPLQPELMASHASAETGFPATVYLVFRKSTLLSVGASYHTFRGGVVYTRILYPYIKK